MINSTVLAAIAILLGLFLGGPQADSSVPPPPRPNISATTGSGVN